MTRKTNIAIYGAGKFGKWVYEKIKNSEYNAVFFIDRNTGIHADVPVISPLEAKWRWKQGYFDKVLLAVLDYYSVEDILLELHEIGMNKIMIAKKEIYGDESFSRNITEIFYEPDLKDKAVICKLEFHVCDHCNLNCSGCSHFAPIYKKSFADLGSFRKDVNRLSMLFSNILRFRLMGGEPFLNTQLGSFVDVVRKSFVNTHLEIVTNGLCLDKVTEYTWDIIRDTNCVLNISLYPPTYEKKVQIEKLLSKKNITYSFGSGLEQYNEEGIINEFHKNLTVNNDNIPQISASKCMGNRCHFLRNGKISKCALPLLADDINDYFNMAYNVVTDDIVDIYDDSIYPWDAIRKLYHPTPFCAYCSEHGTERFLWDTGKSNDLSRYVIT